MDLITASSWCADHLDHKRMNLGPILPLFLGDFESDAKAGALSKAGKWSHLVAIEEGRKSNPPGSLDRGTFRALCADLEKSDRRLMKALWIKHDGRRWNRGTMKTVLAQLHTKMSRGRKARGAAPDPVRDEALDKIQALASDSAGQSGEQGVQSLASDRAEEGSDSPVTGSGNRAATAQSLTNDHQPQGQDSPPSSSPSSPPGEDGDPLAPKGGNRRRSGRKIPSVTIPGELIAIGIDMEAFKERVEDMSKTKPASAWQKELDRLVPMVEEFGGALVLEVFEDASSAGWQGCTPKMVRDAAGSNGNSRSPWGRREGGGGFMETAKRHARAQKEANADALRRGKGDFTTARILPEGRWQALGLPSKYVWEGHEGWEEGAAVDLSAFEFLNRERHDE